MEAVHPVSGKTRDNAAAKPRQKEGAEKPRKKELDRKVMNDATKDLRWLNIEEVRVHHNSMTVDGHLGYQRPLNPNKINRMVDEFDPQEITAIVASERPDGTFWVIDGQHRREALKILGKQVILADVRKGLSLAQEARLFYRLNAGQTKVGAWDQLMARLPWDHVAQSMKRIVEENGYHFDRGGNAVKGIAAVRSVEKVFRRGYLDEVMDIISRSWRTDRRGVDGPIIEGLGIFLHSYKDQTGYDRDRLMDVLAVTSATEVIQRQRQISVEMGRPGRPSVLVAMAIRDIYNGKRRSAHKLVGPPVSGTGKSLGYSGRNDKE